jgi:uncharacterized protein (TIGR00290 family)
MREIAAISSWSGGKDSCLAYYKAVRQGYQIKCLLNFISRETKRGCFHGIEKNLMQAQARAMGIPLIQKEVQKYEDEFKETVIELKTKGISAMVFGDVYLEEHSNWVSRVCRELNIMPIEPLWQASPVGIVEEFIELGFKAVIVSCKADVLDKSCIGRYLDKEMLGKFKAKGVCPCGENGEFHTFVVNGPLFRKGIQILESEPVLKEGFWKYWFLDIKEWA